jgi:RNA polymerase sigma-70 factor (ECF subfamily)
MTSGSDSLRRWEGTGEDLIEELRAGDACAFEALVRNYGGRLLAVARRLLQHEDDARDCVQESFLQAFRHIGQFQGEAAIGTWLHRIAVNQALMKLRLRARQREEPIDDLSPQFDDNGIRVEPMWAYRESVDDMLARQETRETVRAKISALPDNYRIVLMLRDIEEMSTREVAELLQLSEGAVKIRLHRARGALKKLLEPLWKGNDL